ncbi:response regulator transcription factor [Cohnella lubricantis]|uniref:Response regulator transcription factor n=1 Tax=Cohnella lubricantis TaxID=2163172 RepID=A0A841T706_9BACL|nr:response regulator transcription factor [Cohnella lubricantis]MBB6675899.1 response regulator transcription factor [Cohnella lubricantis]MBP2117184.1 DNA-binding NarL/FixJ family response regulator [Cohnella lubricantis]
MIRAIIVDDEPLSAQRLKYLLSAYEDLEVSHTFLTPREAYDYVRAHRIQVAFLDISMPEVDGMSLSRLMLEHDPSISAVFVTGYDDYAVQAFEVNALDYLMKPVTEQRLAQTWEKIKGRYEGAAASEELLAADTLLTGQETRIVQYMTEGLSNKEIADALNITAETVKYHLKNVFRKLDVNNRVKALQRAKELKIVP